LVAGQHRILDQAFQQEVKPVIVIASFGAFNNAADENDAAQVRAFMDNGPWRLAAMGANPIVLQTAVPGQTQQRTSEDRHSSNGPRCIKVWRGRLAVAPEIVFRYVEDDFITDLQAPAQVAVARVPGVG
jgi:hypothetical protein